MLIVLEKLFDQVLPKTCIGFSRVRVRKSKNVPVLDTATMATQIVAAT
jgi:hypothetical protein